MQSPDGDLWVGLSAAPLPVAETHAFLADGRGGGVCVFVGTSRRWTDGRETERLSYEAYGPMAEAELRRLAEAARQRHGVLKAVLLHRTGDVPPPEPSVVVGVVAPHRAEAFEACRWLIDTLKAEVPIWKRERWADGTSEWISPRTHV